MGLNMAPRVLRDGTMTPGFDRDDYEGMDGGRILTAVEDDMADVPDFYAMDPYD